MESHAVSKIEKKQKIPLFTGLTKQAKILGIPMEFFGVNLIIFGCGMIYAHSLLYKFLFCLFICFPLHVYAKLATDKDPHWIEILKIKVTLCPDTPNIFYWKANSYAP